MKELETREEIIAWITEQVEQLPLRLLKMVRGFVRGIRQR